MSKLWFHRQLYWAILLLVIVLSAGGIFVAGFITKDPLDGTRGGALAVGLSLVVLFLRPNYGQRVYKILTIEAVRTKVIIESLKVNPHPASSAPSEKDKIDALVAGAKADTDEQQLQNIFLALSSGIGTLVWGFGDLPATWLIAVLSHWSGAT